MASFVKATRFLARLRLAIFGPSGSGKTLTALRMAHGIGGKIGLIDTERGSASKYADHPKYSFSFDTLLLEDKTLRGYIEAVRSAAAAGYDVLIIDSLSHGWRELLLEVERAARSKFGGNTWAAWSEGTPKQMAFIETLLNYPGHVIATMRSKTEWSISKKSDGRSEVVRLGLAPEEGKGIEYEFDLLLEMSEDHLGRVLKDRTGKYQDQIIEMPGEQFGKDLANWLGTGVAPSQEDFLNFLLPIAISMGVLADRAKVIHLKTILTLSPFATTYGRENLDELKKWLEVFNRIRRAGNLSPEDAAMAATKELQA